MKAIVAAVFNKVTKVQFDEFAGFHIYSSIKEGLPYGYIQVLDRDGTLFGKFENIQVGSECFLEVVSIQNGNPVMAYPLFYVLQVENKAEGNVGKIAGNIKIWFGHQWFLLKDTKNHMYKPTNNGKLIKKILENKDRGFEIKVNEDEDFSKTDDKGLIARYKICETDWDFIQNKIMPYTTIKQQPAHFFCNDMGDFFLKSFKDLYSKNPKFLFLPESEQSGRKDVAEKVTKLLDKYGIDKQLGHGKIKEIDIKISNPGLFKELYPSFYLENNVTGKFIKGAKKIANKAKASDGDLLPLDDAFVGTLTGSSVKMIHNRQLSDAMSLIFQTGKMIDWMFEVTVTTLFCGHMLRLGDNAEIYQVPLWDISEQKFKEHWISGKWLVAAIEHFNDEDDIRTFMTKTTLIRPAFVGKPDNLTLSMPTLMYKVPG
jgi:hypothetical protein